MALYFRGTEGSFDPLAKPGTVMAHPVYSDDMTRVQFFVTEGFAFTTCLNLIIQCRNYGQHEVVKIDSLVWAIKLTPDDPKNNQK
jgi:hypothetical protein